MNKLICVYDNMLSPDAFIKSIIGERTFGDVIIKRCSVKDRFYSILNRLDFIKRIYENNDILDLEQTIKSLHDINPDSYVIHVYSHMLVYDEESFYNIMSKGMYVKKSLCVLQNNKPVVIIVGLSDYLTIVRENVKNLSDIEFYQPHLFDVLCTDSFYDISIHSNFIKYISGGFDARFFNSLEGDDFSVTKTSNDKSKMKAEYSYYHLLPENMKRWHVMPYAYNETETSASYTMERYRIADFAIRYINGAICEEEFKNFLGAISHYIDTRATKTVSKDIYENIQKLMFIDKLDLRINELKTHPNFKKIESLISHGTWYSGIDAIVSKYKNLYNNKIKTSKETQLVIGHGDLCFSNILFYNDANLLKLIDPKGALTEDDLYMHPYYDIAKLSHSVCGNYDYINNGMCIVSLDSELYFDLELRFDNSKYVKLFKKFCAQKGFNFVDVRIFEVSLFLSMLPLHMNDYRKVFGFLLNAINILEGLDKVE